MIFNLYKNRGETPLECLERFRNAKPELQNASMTYLGRLDPLAEGVLLVGTEDDTKEENRKKFFELDKEYDFTAIFGFETDTYDVMGRVAHPLTPSQREGEPNIITNISEIDLIKICKIYEGEREQKYPKYSSKMISNLNILSENQENKTPREQLSDRDWRESEEIFQQKNTPVAREDVFSPDFKDDISSQENVFSEKSSGLLRYARPDFSSKSFPSKTVMIHKLQFEKLETLSNKELFGRILMDISRVKGDFRQEEILEDWKEILVSKAAFDTLLAHFSAHVSSGTYIRSLVNSMGETLGCGATTLSIKRTRVGDYKIEDSIKF